MATSVAALLAFQYATARWHALALAAATVGLNAAWLRNGPVALATYAIVAAGAAIGIAHLATPLHWAVVVASASLLVTVTGEAIVEKVAGVPPRCAHVPGVRPAVLTGPRVVEIAGPATIILSAGWAAIGAPVGVLATILAVVAGYCVAVAAWARRQGGRWPRLRAAVASGEPRFMVHFSAPSSDAFHLLAWLPYLDRIGAPYVVVLREAHSLRPIAGRTRVPVVVCPTSQTLSHMVTPTMRAAFYVNNGALNAHCVRFRELTHIQLLHGDSDKATSYNPVTAMFDRIFVAGQAGIDRYRIHGLDILADKFRIVGRPQVESIQVGIRARPQGEPNTVLYAPTWVGTHDEDNHSSLPIAPAITNALLRRGTLVVFRPHPYSAHDPASARRIAQVEAMLADDRARTRRMHVFGDAATQGLTMAECANLSDALIGDVSAVASDYLYSEKPLAIVNMGRQPVEEFADSFPLALAASVLRRDLSNLDEVLDELLLSDSRRAERLKWKTYYLGPFPHETYADAFLDEARSYL
ncbi:MAG TPA: CDP-glycerol glycerophosphotransferase family protein [Micromonosporaceae bacterium]